jgi:large subunit ribosomal protein L21e
LQRIKDNEAAKAEARKTGSKANLKRQPKAPKEAYFLQAPGGEGTEITTIQPLPFSDLV